MRIQKKLDQYRRDFTAIYECEHCGAMEKGSGYDDAYFHMNVIPQMTCRSCGLSSPTPGVPSSYPDVPAGVIL